MKGRLGVRLSVTWERTPQELISDRKKIYYAAIRFVRLYQLMMTSSCDFFAIDVDSLVRGNLGDALKNIDGDLGMCFRLNRWTFGRRLAAGAIVCRVSPSTLRFFRKLSNCVIRHVFGGSRSWGVDQECLYWTWLMRALNCTPF